MITETRQSRTRLLHYEHRHHHHRPRRRHHTLDNATLDKFNFICVPLHPDEVNFYIFFLFFIYRIYLAFFYIAMKLIIVFFTLRILFLFLLKRKKKEIPIAPSFRFTRFLFCLIE